MPLKVTQVRSTIGSKQNQRATLRTLGLRKIRQSVVRDDTPAVRGMIATVRHLVTVEEVHDGSRATAPSRGAQGGEGGAKSK